MVIGVITIYGQHREHADQHHALPEHVGQRIIRRLIIIGGQGQDTLGDRVHDILTGRLHDHVPDKIRGEEAALGQRFVEIPQFLGPGQLPEQKEIGDLFKAEMLVRGIQKAFYQIVDIVAPVEQPPVTGDHLPVHLFF